MADTDSLLPVHNELLCFVSGKCKVLAGEQLAKICSDFYREDEIVSARNLIDQFCEQRLSKRTGADKCFKTMKDIIKCCVDPEITLPVFYAVKLDRLPPVDINHCDMSIVMKELQSLRQEVRVISSLQVEVENLKSQVVKLMSVNSTSDDNVLPNIGQKAPLPILSYSQALSSSAPENTDVRINSIKPSGNRKKAVNQKSVVFGSSTTNKCVKSAVTTRVVDVFVSRLEPGTTSEDLTNCVNDIKGDIRV